MGVVAFFCVKEILLQLTSRGGSFCDVHVCIINHSNLCRTCILLTFKMLLLERPCCNNRIFYQRISGKMSQDLPVS